LLTSNVPLAVHVPQVGNSRFSWIDRSVTAAKCSWPCFATCSFNTGWHVSCVACVRNVPTVCQNSSKFQL